MMNENPLDCLSERLARGEITKEQYLDLSGTIRQAQQAASTEGINIPLIAFSTILLILLCCVGELTEPAYVETGEALLFGVIMCLIWPLIVFWTRAIWNNVIPRTIGWRKISFWEAAGLCLLAFVLTGA